MLPMPVVMLDDDELLDCDLCKRGLGGENLWCDETQQGYVGGQVVTSYACFECKSAGSHVCESCDEPPVTSIEMHAPRKIRAKHPTFRLRRRRVSRKQSMQIYPTGCP